MRLRLARALLPCAVLGVSPPSAATSYAQGDNDRSTVIVAIFRDYPLFRASERTNGTRDLRAIVIPQDYVDKARSIIILNPAHATPEVLFAALSRLNSTSQGTQLIGITQGGTPAASTLPRPALSALSTTIKELLAVEPSALRGHPSGKHIVLTKEVREIVTALPQLSP